MESENEVEKCRDLVRDTRVQAAANNYKYSTLQREFLLYPEVFNPYMTYELSQFINTSFFKLASDEASNKSQQKSVDFLEVGCGAGYTAISLALLADNCYVWATDINQEAVENAKANAKLHGVESRFHAVKANVFDHEEIGGRKFDMIYWNHPSGGDGTTADTVIEPVLYGIVDPGYQGLHSYLSGAEEHLKETGRLIVGFSFSFGSEEKFAKAARETGWRIKIIDETKFRLADEEIKKHTMSIIELVKDVK